MRIIFFFLLTAVIYSSVPQENIQAKEIVYFADPNLKIAIEKKLGVSEPNSTDMLTLLNLHAYRLGIVDLSGLEYAVNLKKLSL